MHGSQETPRVESHAQSNQVVILSNPGATLNTLISPADSGKTIIVVPQDHDQDFTLPPVAAGLCYRFFANGPVGNIVDIISNPAGRMCGTLLIISTAAVQDGVPINQVVIKNGNNSVSFTAAANIGAYIEMACDGRNWYVTGISTEDGGFA